MVLYLNLFDDLKHLGGTNMQKKKKTKQKKSEGDKYFFTPL